MTKDLSRYENSKQKIHFMDGFGIQYCLPYDWKANLWVRDKIVDIVPVTWADEFKGTGENRFISVHY
jgi:hypothetical protein